ncbi:MAG: transglutaminase family protein [Sphingobium sp.]|nr:transglutaminase family protein [Sphingobium sp.]
MRISIRHETRYEYEAPVGGAVLRLRLRPPTTSGQTVHSWQVSVNESPVERWVTSGYGEGEAVWRAPGKLGEIRVVAEGEVTTFDTAGVTLATNGVRPLLFLRDTPLTTPSAELKALAESARRGTGALDTMHALCQAVHEAMAFKAGVTSFETTAAEALEHGHGVCQDQSHVFIAAARLLAIPARYVSGYLRDPERPDDEHDPHAWAEGWIEELGWVAFDSTLGHCPVEGHVRLTVGLDAADAAPIRAVITQGGGATLSSDVQIAALPLDGEAQVQAQQ